MNDLPAAPPPLSPLPTNWRLYLELLTLAFFFFPFGNIFGPLILWLVKKDTNPIVNEEGKRVLNFNLSWSIWILASCGLGFFPWIVIQIIAILKAANNEPYIHPLTIRFLN